MTLSPPPALTLSWMDSPIGPLQGFAYRSPVSPAVFIYSLLGLLLITFMTVGYETWKAACTNPVHSLRME